MAGGRAKKIEANIICAMPPRKRSHLLLSEFILSNPLPVVNDTPRNAKLVRINSYAAGARLSTLASAYRSVKPSCLTCW